MTAKRLKPNMARLNLPEPAMCATAIIEARIDVLAVAVQCIAASLESVRAREVAAAFSDGCHSCWPSAGR